MNVVKLKAKYRSFLRLNLNHRNRRRLLKKNITIFSSNCVGGGILHDLGLRFNTPTINLWFLPDDFLRFLGKPQEYIYNEKLVEDAELGSKYGYPVGILGDIRIYFQHYSSFNEARAKWNERCKRINWSEIYVTMCERGGGVHQII